MFIRTLKYYAYFRMNINESQEIIFYFNMSAVKKILYTILITLIILSLYIYGNYEINQNQIEEYCSELDYKIYKYRDDSLALYNKKISN